MPGFGANAILSISRQNSFDGTTTPASWYKIPFASHDFDFSFDELLDDSIQARYDEPDRVTGIAGVTGAITQNVHPLVTGMFLRGVFGITSPGVTAVGSGFTHVFNPQTTTFDTKGSLPPYSFQVDQGESAVNSAYLLTDCFVNNWELSLAAGQYLRQTVNIVGKGAALGTKAPPPDWPAAVRPFIWSAVSISIGGAAVQRYQEFRLSFNNNLGMQDRIAGAKEHTYFFRDGFRQFGRFTGTMDMAMTDWLNVKNETEVRLAIYALGITSISSGVNEYLMVDLPRFVFTKHPIGVPGPGMVTVAIEGRAMYSSTSGTIATVTLQNTFAKYMG